MYDLIIIGAGPAGLSAAVYGRRAGFELLVVEQTPMGGGQVVDTYEVDNYLGMPGINGFDLAQNSAVMRTGSARCFKVDGLRRSGMRARIKLWKPRMAVPMKRGRLS